MYFSIKQMASKERFPTFTLPFQASFLRPSMPVFPFSVSAASIVSKRLLQLTGEGLEEAADLLHSETVDYQCRVFVNGRLCAEHTGGNVGFAVDIRWKFAPDIGRNMVAPDGS